MSSTIVTQTGLPIMADTSTPTMVILPLDLSLRVTECSPTDSSLLFRSVALLRQAVEQQLSLPASSERLSIRSLAEHERQLRGSAGEIIGSRICHCIRPSGHECPDRCSQRQGVVKCLGHQEARPGEEGWSRGPSHCLGFLLHCGRCHLSSSFGCEDHDEQDGMQRTPSSSPHILTSLAVHHHISDQDVIFGCCPTCLRAVIRPYLFPTYTKALTVWSNRPISAEQRDHSHTGLPARRISEEHQSSA